MRNLSQFTARARALDRYIRANKFKISAES